jgi:hypothetical protein
LFYTHNNKPTRATCNLYLASCNHYSSSMRFCSHVVTALLQALHLYQYCNHRLGLPCSVSDSDTHSLLTSISLKVVICLGWWLWWLLAVVTNLLSLRTLRMSTLKVSLFFSNSPLTS